jgi:hypothetical protein
MSTDEAPAGHLTAVQRFYAAIGKPVPRPLTEAELLEFEAAEDRADAEIERLYGPRSHRPVT